MTRSNVQMVIGLSGFIMIPGAALLWNTNAKRTNLLSDVPTYANEFWMLQNDDGVRAVQFEVFGVALIWALSFAATFLKGKPAFLFLQAFIAGLMYYMLEVSNNLNWGVANMLRVWRNRTFPSADLDFPSELEKLFTGIVLCYIAAFLCFFALASHYEKDEGTKLRLSHFSLAVVFVMVGSILLWTSKAANFGTDSATETMALQLLGGSIVAVVVFLFFYGASMGANPALASSTILLIGFTGFFLISRMLRLMPTMDANGAQDDKAQVKAGFVLDWLCMLYTVACAAIVLTARSSQYESIA